MPLRQASPFSTAAAGDNQNDPRRIGARPEGEGAMKSNERFTQKAEGAIENALAAAKELGHSYVGSEHLLLGILSERDSLGARALLRCGAGEKTLRRLLAKEQGRGCRGGAVQGLNAEARRLMEKAGREAQSMHRGSIGTEHLLLAMLREEDCAAMGLLRAAGVDTA